MKVFQQLCLLLTFCMLFEPIALRPFKKIRKLNDEEYFDDGEHVDEDDEDYPEDEEDYYDDEEYHDEEHHEEEHHEEEHHEGDDMIHFEDNSETEHLRNFKKISEDLKVYEDEYS